MFLRKHVYNICILASVLSSCTYTFYSTTCDYPVPGIMHKLTTISDTLYETSGMQRSGNEFISFNDSGGEPKLYLFGKNGNIVGILPDRGALNIDWETMAEDDEYYYIGDVGNNRGIRDTLIIYRVPKSKSGLESWDISQNIINFVYNEEVSRDGRGRYSHDCEAALAYRDSIYLFAKDWVKQETRVYALPSKPGHYSLKARSDYQVNALITGADILRQSKEVVLVGYRNFIPILIRYKFADSPASIACGGKARKYPWYFGTQTEAVTFGEQGEIFITAEKSRHKQALYRAY